MANLRGGTYEKQIKSAFHKLEAFSISRHGSSDHNTHSDGLAKKREMYLNDYKSFAENRNFDSKLNQTMTENNLSSFLNERLEGLSTTTKTDYIRGYSSLIQGLQENNITVALDRKYFDSKVAEIKAIEPTQEVKTDRAIKDIDKVIKNLYELNYNSGVIAQTQLELGLRVSEAMELIKHPHKYIKNNQVQNLTGKGNHKYNSKSISLSLHAKIKAVTKLPHKNTYRNHISKVTNNQHTPHSMRYNYAKSQFNTKLKEGIPYRQILKEISQGLNHSREEMTNYYMKRA